jgi:hypothetical protein
MEHFKSVISQTGMRNFSTLGVEGPSEGKTARILDGRSLHLLCANHERTEACSTGRHVQQATAQDTNPSCRQQR